ncbi:MAG: hypothetical protein AABX31_03610 [Nanoarchaeota archaeon]
MKNRSMVVIVVTSIIVTDLVILAIISKRKLNNHKKLLFSLMVIPIIAATLYTAGTTIYLNHISATKGPVHWHADFEVWNCGKKLDVINPNGLSNRIGTPVFHEHNDFRIHIEGVVIKTEDVALDNFVNVIGGALSEESLGVPTNEGIVLLRNGDLCSGKPGKVQVFVYTVANPQESGKWIYTQEKIEDYANYVLAPYSHVPPGDCIIVEFDREKERTDKICTTYQVALDQGELHGR